MILKPKENEYFRINTTFEDPMPIEDLLIVQKMSSKSLINLPYQLNFILNGTFAGASNSARHYKYGLCGKWGILDVYNYGYLMGSRDQKNKKRGRLKNERYKSDRFRKGIRLPDR